MLEAVHLHAIHNQSGQIGQVLAIVFAKVGVSLAIDKAHRTQLFTCGCRKRLARVKADEWRTKHKRIRRKAQIRERVRHEQNVVLHDRMGAKRHFPAGLAHVKPDTSFEKLSVPVDERDKDDGDSE
ncbi:hypothetical protein GCM10025795_28240 [Verticiella sediminum]